MPIAKGTIKIGNTVVANEGGYVTREAVSKYGKDNNWDVDDGPDIGGTSKDEAPDAAAQAAKKGSAPK